MIIVYELGDRTRTPRLGGWLLTANGVAKPEEIISNTNNKELPNVNAGHRTDLLPPKRCLEEREKTKRSSPTAPICYRILHYKDLDKQSGARSVGDVLR